MIQNLLPQATALHGTRANDAPSYIHATTLQQFLVTKFVPVSPGKISPDFKNKVLQAMEELEDCGILTLEQLNAIIPPHLRDTIEENEGVTHLSLLGLVRTILVLHDREKYFTLAWHGGWQWLTADMKAIFTAYNVPLDTLPVNAAIRF